jgi:hypothetical protein
MSSRTLQTNKPLVPTRNGEAPLLAVQRRRYARFEHAVLTEISRQ